MLQLTDPSYVFKWKEKKGGTIRLGNERPEVTIDSSVRNCHINLWLILQQQQGRFDLHSFLSLDRVEKWQLPVNRWSNLMDFNDSNYYIVRHHFVLFFWGFWMACRPGVCWRAPLVRLNPFQQLGKSKKKYRMAGARLATRRRTFLPWARPKFSLPFSH